MHLVAEGCWRSVQQHHSATASKHSSDAIEPLPLSPPPAVCGMNPVDALTILAAVSVVRVVVAMAVLCVVVAIGVYVVSIFRDYGDAGGQSPSATLPNLEEMLRQGDINENEYRTIKASNRASDPSDPSPGRTNDGSSS